MKWEKWRPKYEKIANKLDLNLSEDRRAGRIMMDLIEENKLTQLKDKIGGDECVVFGAGPSLENDLEKLKESGMLDRTLISADGATSAVLKYEVPDVIVTDLDGKVEDQMKAWQSGSWIVVHAHGDNIKIVKEIVPELSERVIGTTQVDEPTQLHNFGGFTDGDRAAFMAHELGADKIYLAGMDLGEEIGKYTGETDFEKKPKKLSICKHLLSWLAKDLGAEIINLTVSGEDIPGIPREKVI